MMEQPAGFKPVVSAPEIQRLADLRPVPETEKLTGLRKVSSLSAVGMRKTDPRSAARGLAGSSTEEDSSGQDDSSSVKSSWSLVSLESGKTVVNLWENFGKTLGEEWDWYPQVWNKSEVVCYALVSVGV